MIRSCQPGVDREAHGNIATLKAVSLCNIELSSTTVRWLAFTLGLIVERDELGEDEQTCV